MNICPGAYRAEDGISWLLISAPDPEGIRTGAEVYTAATALVTLCCKERETARISRVLVSEPGSKSGAQFLPERNSLASDLIQKLKLELMLTPEELQSAVQMLGQPAKVKANDPRSYLTLTNEVCLEFGGRRRRIIDGVEDDSPPRLRLPVNMFSTLSPMSLLDIKVGT